MTELSYAYLGALSMMQVTGPQDLHSAATFVASGADLQIGDAALIAYLTTAEPKNQLQMDLSLKLATWDHLGTNTAWTLGTAPNTIDRRERIISLLGLGAEAAELMLTLFPIAGAQSPTVIAAKWEPWYNESVKAQRSFYWAHYSSYLADKRGWEPSAIATLDVATDEIIERLSNPERAEAYQAKGLVVGHVQSGKTANFTGVIGKSIDVGYRLIIVLTGTTDLLRSQTQRRLDMELVGQENILRGVNPNDHEALEAVDYYNDDPDWVRFLRHGFRPQDAGRPDIHRLTTHYFDYKSLKQGIAALDFERRERGLPFFHPDNLFSSDARLVVVKKNSTVLRKVVGDLNKITARLGEIPALLIDDESDQASVNTSNPKRWIANRVERTTINGLISQLLMMLPRAQYIGYTATPFANVFIDPSDAEDIFPRNFIISLRRPPGYMGASDFHDLESEILPEERTYENSAEKAHIRLFKDDDPTEMNTRILEEAIDSYVLAGAVKLYREKHGFERFRHHTMLFHQAMRRAHHRAQAEQIEKLWNSAGYHSPTCLDRLRALYNSDTLPVSRAKGDLPAPDFDGLVPYIGGATERIGQNGTPVLIVNSDKIEGEELDFDRNEVWRILVGGNKFARGFTIEGLTVSYYGRPIKNADTLMQMGRWFGFRQGYQDLVRLYTTSKLYEAFEAVCLDEQFFRDEIQQYSVMIDGAPQVVPAEVPPLVASHLPKLRPAAPNKMYNAELAQRRTANKEPTGYPGLKEHKALAHNTNAFTPLLKAASAKPARTLTYNGRVFEVFGSEVAHADVLHVLDALIWDNEECFKADLAWLKTLTKKELDRWLVWLPQLKNPRNATINGLGPFSLHTRATSDEYLNVKTTLDDRWAIEEQVLTPGSTRGGMLVYPMVPNGLEHPPGTGIDPGSLVMAFRLMLPRSATPADGRLVTFVARDNSRRDQPIIDRAASELSPA